MEIVTAVEETPVVVSASGQQLSLLSLPGDKRDGLSVEGYEGFPAEPITFVGDYAIGEVTACIENRQSGCNGRTMEDDIAGIKQGVEGCGNFLVPEVCKPGAVPEQTRKGR